MDHLDLQDLLVAVVAVDLVVVMDHLDLQDLLDHGDLLDGIDLINHLLIHSNKLLLVKMQDDK